MAIRTIDRPSTLPCECGGTMQPAQRFEATRTIPVAICWRCGTEDPPYGQPVKIRRLACRWCGRSFTTRGVENVCSTTCADARTAYHDMRRKDGQSGRAAS